MTLIYCIECNQIAKSQAAWDHGNQWAAKVVCGCSDLNNKQTCPDKLHNNNSNNNNSYDFSNGATTTAPVAAATPTANSVWLWLLGLRPHAHANLWLRSAGFIINYVLGSSLECLLFARGCLVDLSAGARSIACGDPHALSVNPLMRMGKVLLWAVSIPYRVVKNG